MKARDSNSLVGFARSDATLEVEQRLVKVVLANVVPAARVQSQIVLCRYLMTPGVD